MTRSFVLLLAAALIVPLPSMADSTPATAPADEAPIDEAALEGETPRTVIVSTERAVDDDLRDALDEHGQVLEAWDVIDGAYVLATPDQVRDIAGLAAVDQVHADEELEWHLGTSRPAVGVTEAVWRTTSFGANTTVAVVDTGIDGNHPSMQGQVKTEVEFTGNGQSNEVAMATDDRGHGTHVAGIVAGTGEQSKLLDSGNNRYAGVGPQTQLVSLDISKSFSTGTAIDAFEWVHDNYEEYDISVVQNSWGRKEVGQAYDPDDPAIEASNTLVGEDDLVVVFSAANEGPKPQTLALEAMNPNVLTVGAVDDSGEPAEFSSRGPVMLENGSKASWVKPGVAAPGVQISSAGANMDSDTYLEKSGTSQAAPHVAGIAALLQARYPDLSAPEIHEIVRQSGQDIGPDGPDPVTGYGFVDAQTALRLADRAGNGTLFTTTEHYVSRGTITGPQPLQDVLPSGEGVESESVNGTIPVKPAAQELDLQVNWTQSQDGLQVPDLEVTLTDPSGTDLLVPVDGNRAQRTIEDPAAGTWEWTLEAGGQGAADYTVNGTVTLEQELLGPQGDATGGFNPGEVPEQIQQAFQDAFDRFGVGPVGVAASIAVLALVGLTRVIGG